MGLLVCLITLFNFEPVRLSAEARFLSISVRKKRNCPSLETNICLLPVGKRSHDCLDANRFHAKFLKIMAVQGHTNGGGDTIPREVESPACSLWQFFFSRNTPGAMTALAWSCLCFPPRSFHHCCTTKPGLSLFFTRAARLPLHTVSSRPP